MNDAKAAVAKDAAARRVVVIGAGRMGADIALAFVLGGWHCDVLENDAAGAQRARAHWQSELKRRRATRKGRALHLHDDIRNIEWRSVDLVIEALPEKLALKHAVLREVEPLVRASALIATNTSSLRIGSVLSVLRRPARGAGLHFSLPAHVILAVEITRSPATSSGTLRRLTAWMEELGKVPIVLQRDVPGMVINRLQHAMYREIYHLIESGVASPRDIDRAVRFGFGFRYSILGPVVSRDINGVPIHLEVARQLYPTLHNGKKPPRLLERMVRQGHHGVRTGRGFYAWDAATTAHRLDEFSRLLEDSVRRVRRVGEPTDF